MVVERRIEFLLEQQARFDAQQTRFSADFDERLKRHEERHDREMAAIRAELRRGVRLAVEEARRERKRRKEDATDEKLAASHAEFEQPPSGFSIP